MMRLAYTHADVAVRMSANDYFDFDTAQTESFRPRLARFHTWHREAELPQYAVLAEGAAQRVASGVDAGDVAWALEQSRARFRLVTARAIEEASPVVAMFGPANFTALERKLEKSNTELERRYWSSDDARRLEGRLETLRKRFVDWLGELTSEQDARIVAYARSSPHYSIDRLTDRKRRQQEFIGLLKEHRAAPDLSDRLKRFLVTYERDRDAGYPERAREWDVSLTALIVDIDRLLRPEQRTRVVARLRRHAEEFRQIGSGK